MNKFIFFYVY